MLGRYLNALPREALDRIAGAKAWRVHGYVDHTGARCLLGHAENWYWDDATQASHCRAPHLLSARENAGDSWLNWPPLIGLRFDHLVERFGLAHAVRAIHQRAAHRLAAERANPSSAPAPGSKLAAQTWPHPPCRIPQR